MGKKAKQAAGKMAATDRKATHRAARDRNQPAMRVVGVLKEVADQPQLIALASSTLAIGLVTRRRDLARGGARMLAAHLLATGIKAVLKNRIDRSRPARTLQDGKPHLGTGKGDADSDFNSFPSGHTAGAVAVARAAVRDIDGIAVPATLAVAAVAAAQPATGSHYLSDVAAGGTIGWLSEAAVSLVFDQAASRVERWLGRQRIASSGGNRGL